MSNISLTKAILIFITTIITTIITVYGHLPYGFVSIISSFVIIYMYSDKILKMAYQRLIGSFIAVLLMFILLPLEPHTPILFIILSALLLFLVSYFYAQNQSKSYAFIFCMITITLISNESLANGYYLGFKLGIFWILNIAIAVFLTLGLTYLIKNFSSKLKLHQTVENKPINNAGWYNYNFISTLVAIRITLSVLIVSIINWHFNITDINLQALITTLVVTSQRSTQNFNRKIWNRLLGILIGCVLAIIYAKICIFFKQQWLLVSLLTIFFTISILIDKKIKYAKYIILQAVIMIPIISLTDSHSLLNSKLLYERSLGSIEGAIIAIIIFYIIHIFGKKIKN